MPSAPTVERLEKLRPATVKALDDIAGLCPNGGRVLHRKAIGDYSARKVVHWHETGEYPSEPIKPTCGEALCVDCGRPGLAPPPDPEPEPIEVVASPPPVPEPPARSVELVRVVEAVEPEPLERSSRGARSRVVPWFRSSASSVRQPAIRAVLWAVVAVVVFLFVVVLVQGLALAVSNVGDAVPKLDVQTSTTVTLPG